LGAPRSDLSSAIQVSDPSSRSPALDESYSSIQPFCRIPERDETAPRHWVTPENFLNARLAHIKNTLTLFPGTITC
jgi:hypothetical protein